MTKFILVSNKQENLFQSELNNLRDSYNRVEVKGFQTETTPGNMAITYSCLVECFTVDEEK